MELEKARKDEDDEDIEQIKESLKALLIRIDSPNTRILSALTNPGTLKRAFTITFSQSNDYGRDRNPPQRQLAEKGPLKVKVDNIKSTNQMMNRNDHENNVSPGDSDSDDLNFLDKHTPITQIEILTSRDTPDEADILKGTSYDMEGTHSEKIVHVHQTNYTDEMANNFRPRKNTTSEIPKMNEPQIQSNEKYANLQEQPGSSAIPGYKNLAPNPYIKLMVVGSSIIRDINASLVEKYCPAITKCIPGAKIKDVRNMIYAYGCTHSIGNLIIHVGGNEIDCHTIGSPQKLAKKIIEFLDDIQEALPDTRIFFSEILPRYNDFLMPFISLINQLVHMYCESHSIVFVQHLDFCTRYTSGHYARMTRSLIKTTDNVHPTTKGTLTIAKNLIRSYRNYNSYRNRRGNRT